MPFRQPFATTAIAIVITGASLAQDSIDVGSDFTASGLARTDGTLLVLGQHAAGALGGSGSQVGLVPVWLAQIAGEPTTATWTCLSGTNNWSTTACWSGLAGTDPYPDRGSVTYDVTLPAGGYTVLVNPPGDNEIMMDGGLHIAGDQTTLQIASGVSFVLNDAATIAGTARVLGSLTAGPGANVNIDGAAIEVQAGGLARLPAVSYTGSGHTLSADGASSLLDLPALVSATATVRTVAFQANHGGTVNLPLLDTASGIFLRVSGAKCAINAPSLATMGPRGGLAVTDGGQINLAPLTSLDSLEVTLDGAATVADGPGSNLDLSQVASAVQARINIAHASATFAALTSFTGSSLKGFVVDGPTGSISLPALTTANGPGVGNIIFHANHGAQLSAPNWTNTSGSVALQVANGGVLTCNLSRVSAGNIQLANGGTLIAAPFTDFDGFNITSIGAGNVFDTSQISTADDAGLVTTNGAVLSFPALTRYRNGVVDGSGDTLRAEHVGSRLEFPNLTLVDGGDALITFLRIEARDGGVISAPQALFIGSAHLSTAGTSGSWVEIGSSNLGIFGYLGFATNSELRVHGDLSYAMTDASRFLFGAGSSLVMLGGAFGDCTTLEVGGQDVGNDPGGFDDNFEIGRLRIGPGAHVRLVDALDNRPGTGAEALYVETIEFSDGSGRLDAGGLPLYYNSLIGDPSQLRAVCRPVDPGTPNASPIGNQTILDDRP